MQCDEYVREARQKKIVFQDLWVMRKFNIYTNINKYYTVFTKISKTFHPSQPSYLRGLSLTLTTVSCLPAHNISEYLWSLTKYWGTEGDPPLPKLLGDRDSPTKLLGGTMPPRVPLCFRRSCIGLLPERTLRNLRMMIFGQKKNSSSLYWESVQFRLIPQVRFVR